MARRARSFTSVLNSNVHTTWQGLRAVYLAPEAEQLVDATLPVQSVSESTGEDIHAAAAALLHYSDEVRDIQVRLTALQGRAAEFEADMRVVDDPGSEQAYVDQNNDLVSAVNAAMADFDDAQRRCANAINALYSGGITFRADDEDGVAEVDEFGATAAQYDDAAARDEGVPWGRIEPDAPPPDPHGSSNSLTPCSTSSGWSRSSERPPTASTPAGCGDGPVGRMGGHGRQAGPQGRSHRRRCQGVREGQAVEGPVGRDGGHLGAGQRYVWTVRTGTDQVTGEIKEVEKTVRYHAHGPDPTRPPTDNAGAGLTYRVRVGHHYLDAEGNRHTAKSVDPNY